MMINDENKRSVKKMLTGRALYIALGVCVLAAGAVGYTAVNNSRVPHAADPATTQAVTYKSRNDALFSDETSAPLQYEAQTTAAPAENSTAPAEAVFDNNAEPLSAADNTETTVAPLSFTLPVNGRVVSGYSMGVPVYSSTMGDYRTHNGVDIECAEGDGISAVADGTVISVKRDTSWGNMIEIDHGGGLVSVYCGLADEGMANIGAVVEEGALIGTVGYIPVEAEDKVHIHFEMRSNGALQDPLEILGYSGDSAEE